MKNKHIGLNFDDFLKEECIEFEEQEFKKGINIPSRQIIINGVDVNGCYYYADGKCTNCQMTQWNCKNVAVCYYKEYKRKEKECKDLKKINKKLKHSFKELNVYIEKAQEWLKKQKSNDIFIDEMKAILLEELKCLKKK